MQVVKYFNEIMPIIITTCCKCNKELFRSMTMERTDYYRSYCQGCSLELEDKAWKYDQLNK
jgi:hypothetical protein